MQNAASADSDVESLLDTLSRSFNILAGEVQLLSDRKTILEHKLRFAHEQYQQLADKYAPLDPSISSTLAQLQLPPDLSVQPPDSPSVPLPRRLFAKNNSKHQTALIIRDGRRASSKLAALRGSNDPKHSYKNSVNASTTNSNIMRSSRGGTTATLLEHDFTVQGKKSQLLCPFAATMEKQATPDSTTGSAPRSPGHGPHDVDDPICVALYPAMHEQERRKSSSTVPPSATSGPAKCPIRYMDQHSPEEIAQYFETHKHEIPRSHEVCVKRYQRNEQDIRMLDAKYGSLVSMIQGLGIKHKPMLADPHGEGGDAEEVNKSGNEMVERWANGVSSDSVHGLEESSIHNDQITAATEVDDLLPAHHDGADDEERESRFDRPLKEVRVGESPSRPWGIPVPFVEDDRIQATPSSPARPSPSDIPPTITSSPINPDANQASVRPKGKCPFGHGAGFPTSPAANPHVKLEAESESFHIDDGGAGGLKDPATEARKQATAAFLNSTQDFDRLTGADMRDNVESNGGLAQDTGKKSSPSGTAQIVFNGPVFIGYPVEQAVAFLRELGLANGNGNANGPGQ